MGNANDNMQKLDIQINDNTVGVALVVSNDYKPSKLTLNTQGDSDKMEQLFEEFGYVVYKKCNLSKECFFVIL